jgi:hypothetical protein
MHKEDFIGRVEVVIEGEDMDINLYNVSDSLINKDSLSKGEQQLYATSILKALVDESGIQFPVFIDSPLQKFDKSHATKIITEFYPIKKAEKYTIVDIKLHTGRTHQIRGYFSFLGHPVINDTKYGRNNEINPNYKGYFLTAYKIKFNLTDDLKYLNDLNIEITPSWIDFLK